MYESSYGRNYRSIMAICYVSSIKKHRREIYRINRLEVENE